MLTLATTSPWKPTIKGVCIANLTSGTPVENVVNMISCQILCERSDVICLSVNYLQASKKCYFNSADTSTVAVEPCSSYNFSEPVRSELLFQSL